jgi:hypothetical protein
MTPSQMQGELMTRRDSFLQLGLALDQVLGVLCIAVAQRPQPDGGTMLRDDQEVGRHQQVTLNRDVVDVGKGDGGRSSLTYDFGVNELDTVVEYPQTLVAYGRRIPC